MAVEKGLKDTGIWNIGQSTKWPDDLRLWLPLPGMSLQGTDFCMDTEYIY